MACPAQHPTQRINIYILGVLLAPSISTWGDKLGYKFTKKLFFQGKSFGLISRSVLIPGDNWQSCSWGQTSRDLAHSVTMRELFCKPRVTEFCHVVRMIKTGLSKAKPLILLLEQVFWS